MNHSTRTMSSTAGRRLMFLLLLLTLLFQLGIPRKRWLNDNAGLRGVLVSPPVSSTGGQLLINYYDQLRIPGRQNLAPFSASSSAPPVVERGVEVLRLAGSTLVIERLGDEERPKTSQHGPLYYDPVPAFGSAVILRGATYLSNPATYLLILAVAGFLLPGQRITNRRLGICTGLALGLFPYLLHLITNYMWSAPHLFETQHTMVARNMALSGVYGWTEQDLLKYGMPPTAGSAWGAQETPVPTAWTYPGYTALLGVVFYLAKLIGFQDVSSQLLATMAIDTAMVAFAVAFIFAAIYSLISDAFLSGVAAAVFCLTGWPISVAVEPTTETLQLLINSVALFLISRAMVSTLTSTAFRTSVMILCALIGIGQIVKPVLGPLVPGLALAGVVAINFPARRTWGKSKSSARYLVLCAALILFPSFIWTFRNYHTFGRWIFLSTAGSCFFAQGLDPVFTLPADPGKNELEYAENCARQVPELLQKVRQDKATRDSLIEEKLNHLAYSVTGNLLLANSLKTSGWGGGYAYLAFFSLFAAASLVGAALWNIWGAFIVCSGLAFIAVSALLFVSQPLARYFLPYYPMYLTSVAALARGIGSRSLKQQVVLVTLLLAVAAGTMAFFLETYGAAFPMKGLYPK